MSASTYEPFMRATLEHLSKGLDLSYEDLSRDLQDGADRLERMKLIEKWNALTPDGRTIGEVLQAEARKTTSDAALPAVGSFHG